MSAALIADEWITTQLSADLVLAALGIHSDLAPQGEQPPYVVFQCLNAPRDMNGLGGTRIKSGTLYAVKVIGAGQSYAAIEDAANRIDQLLHNTSGTTSRGRVLSCVREQEIHYPEATNGQHYRHLGGIYRIQVQEI